MDNAATTRVTPPVLAAMLPYFDSVYGNPSSIHSAGQKARIGIENARRQVAKAINADPSEIYFTSGGTESDNWAISSFARGNLWYGNHIITTNIEHHAVLETLMRLEKEGFDVTYLPVDNHGLISPDQLEAAITDNTILVSIMYANNEIGTIQPIPELAAVAAKHGVCFHTDAVQAVGHFPIDVKAQHIDLLSISGHKFHAPKGVGALYIKNDILLPNFMQGGSQEFSKRPGTENVPGIVGLGKAIELATSEIEAKSTRITNLRDHMVSRILNEVNGSSINGCLDRRIDGNANMAFDCVDGEALLLYLDSKGIAASVGSACSSNSLKPSHVLKALGLSDAEAHSSIRLSIGDENTLEEIDYAVDRLVDAVSFLRHLNDNMEDLT